MTATARQSQCIALKSALLHCQQCLTFSLTTASCFHMISYVFWLNISNRINKISLTALYIDDCNDCRRRGRLFANIGLLIVVYFRIVFV